MYARVMSLLRLLPLLAVLFLLALAGANPVQSKAYTDTPSTPLWDPSCYRTNAQIEAFLQNVASSYPQIATLTDAGLSWENTRHLWLLKMGSSLHPEPKPAIYLVAGQHPRDIATPEMLMRYISYLAQNYGVDPDVTWVLDNRSIWIMPMSNPDGYYQVYNNGFNWYKNTDNNDGCTDARFWGTDINRNYPFHWNEGGTGSSPCDSSYPGPSALSEPEAQHVLSAFQTIGADLVISLQAPGPTILYPWGWSSTPPTDAAGLDALGWKLGRLNSTPRASVHTHNASGLISGILDDTIYGQYGVPAYTFNIGASVSPVCATLDTIWSVQRPALLYATEATGLTAGATLSHAFGPDTSQLTVTAGLATSSIQLTGVISANYGTVAGAVYMIDEPGSDGSGTSMSGNYGGGTANVSASVDTSGLSNSRHLLLVQGKNDAQQWGVLSSLFFTVTGNVATPTPQSSLTATSTILPTIQPSSTSSSTSTNTPTRNPTTQPSATMTPTTTALSATNSPTPSRTLTSTITSTSSSTPTRTGTPEPTDTRTPTNVAEPTGTRTPTLTYTPTSTRTWTPTRTPTYTRTSTPTDTPNLPDTATPLPCANYTDVYTNQYFYRAIDWLTCHFIISGYTDGTFRPYNPTTRAQIVKMVVIGEAWPIYTPPQPTFRDVSPNDWFYQVIETAFSHGVISGYSDGTFLPNNHVTRGQLSKIIVGARGWTLADPAQPHFIDVPPGSTFYPYIETAQARAVVGGYGDGTFRPSAEATRGQLSKMLYIALTQDP